MTVEPAPPVRKRPWELHAVVCLLAVVVGCGVSEKWHRGGFDWIELTIIAALPVSLAGLFLGRKLAWWLTTLLFAFLSFGEIWNSVELVLRYGFRGHRLLLQSHLQAGTYLVTLGLLISCRIRKAFPAPVRPVWEDFPGFGRVAAVVTPIVIIGATFWSFGIVFLFQSGRYYGERTTSYTVKTIASAEADFRANDRDGNHINDFWTGDVAGLYGIADKSGPAQGQVKLIELSLAAADGDPLQGAYPPLPAEHVANGGVWFQALNADRSRTPPEPYRGPGRTFHPGSFGFIAYPDDYVAGLKYAFIVSENNTIFRRALKDDIRASDRTPPGPLKDADFTDWPSDGDLKAKWAKLD